MTDPEFPRRLAARLADSLPGGAAQALLAPELSYGRQSGPPAADARQAAVVMLCYPRDDRWYLPLTLRPGHLPEHAGQISLPGGLVEPGETSPQAALRELAEELGVVSGVKLLGELSEFHVFVSNYRVRTWIATTAARPDFRPNPDEVAELLEIPLDHLLDPTHGGSFLVERGPIRYRAPCFDWQGHRVWGATAMMLAELLALLRDAPGLSGDPG